MPYVRVSERCPFYTAMLLSTESDRPAHNGRFLPTIEDPSREKIFDHTSLGPDASFEKGKKMFVAGFSSFSRGWPTRTA